MVLGDRGNKIRHARVKGRHTARSFREVYALTTHGVKPVGGGAMKQDFCLDFTRKRKNVGVVMRSSTPSSYSSPSMDGGCRHSCCCQIQTQGTLHPPKEAHKQSNCAHPCWKRHSQERCMPSYQASMQYPSRLKLLPRALPGARLHGEKEIKKKCLGGGKSKVKKPFCVFFLMFWSRDIKGRNAGDVFCMLLGAPVEFC